MKLANSLVLTSALVIASIPSSVWSSPVEIDNNSILARAVSPKAVNLLSASNFVALGKSGVSTVSPSAITGNIGLSPSAATFITGFSLIQDSTNVFASSTQVVGKLFASNYAVPTPSNLITAISDVNTAYLDASGRPNPDFLNLGAGSIGGLVLGPGLYKWTTDVRVLTDVTLRGSSTDVWIFQISGTLAVAGAKKVILVGGLAKNVFWQVAGGATIGPGGHFEGILLSKTTAVLQTGASMNGRILAQTAVTFQKAVLTQPL
ncbi:hypothetical protein Hypma_007823 [Hypsizygus marmoreus]|uniref:Antifreeze protein n=1 Tax=Hypsizygus marmoreus TaxID=39966 RepID=A0A369JT18_HYPMA|nr:hypothetical protein Hypma_007823 [Hypsizygus marmoreus]